MIVSFRVDANERIGLGHLARCLRIASELRHRGNMVNFVLGASSKPFVSRVAEAGFDFHIVATASLSDVSAPEALWSEKIQLDDASVFLEAVAKFSPDMVVVDHYGLDGTWESKVAAEISNLVALDDLANRTHSCKLLLDYNLPNKEKIYEKLVPAGTRVLSGLRYAPIGSEYFSRRGDQFRAKDKVSSISVFLGGGASFEALSVACRAALAVFADVEEVRVVVPPNFEKKNELIKEVGSSKLTIVPPLPSLAVEYTEADLAIGAAGVSSIERLALGMPTATLVTAENQFASAIAIQQATKMPFLDVRSGFKFDEVRDFLVSIRQDFLRFETQAFLSQFLVDRFGIDRILSQLIGDEFEQLTLRLASISDCATYFLWVNDPQVRDSSLDENSIDSGRHYEWFVAALDSKDAVLYVAELGGLPIGQLRLNRINQKWWLDYSIDVDFRGKGFAKQLVRKGLMLFAAAQPDANVGALVKALNVASSHVLRDCDFIENSTLVELKGVLEYEWRGFAE